MVIFMNIINNPSVRVCKILRNLRIGTLSFGNNAPTWHWKRPFFTHYLEFKRGLNHNVIIVGESGGGKSNACKVMIKAVHEKGANLIILDPHNEYLGIADSISAEVYDAAYNGINIFDLDGMSEKEKTSEITGMFKRIFRLGDVQSSILYKCIMYTYNISKGRNRNPNISDLLYTVQVFKKHADASEGKVLEGLEKRLTLIDNESFSHSVSMSEIMKRNSIMLLSNLHTNESQTVYMEGFLRKIYSYMLAMGIDSSPRIYIVIDEAAKLGESPILGKITAEGRKYGVGVIAVSQRLKMLDKEMRSNSSLLISFYQREPEELNYIANFIAGGNELNRFAEVKKALRSLRMGQAIICNSHDSNPIIGSFDICGENPTSISFKVLDLSRDAISRTDLCNKMLKYGCERSTIEKKVEELLNKRRLFSYDLRDTKNLDDTWYSSVIRNSPEHDICVRLISRYLSMNKIKNEVYNKAYGPDVIAYHKYERIALEYETGTKAPEQLSRMLEQRKRAFNKIIVVISDAHYDKYPKLNGIRYMTRSSFFQDKLNLSF